MSQFVGRRVLADDVWTVKRVLEWIEGYLAQHGDENPRLAAQWLVGEALDVSRMQLFLDAERPLTADERAVLRDWTRRRGASEPLQYITGKAAFRHITVSVRPGVLIPRSETEVLVSEALALLPAAPKPQDQLDAELLRQYAELGGDVEGDDGAGADTGAGANDMLLVADICTGSGCIACSIAFEHPRVHVVATDISPDAVALARENATELGLDERVDVVECDLAEGVDPTLLGSFDLIVSNPPYIPTDVLASLPHEVAGFEPSLALDGGADGLDMFRRLVDWCASALAPGGAFAFELHEDCLEDAAAEAEYSGFCDVRIVEDLAGRPRVLTGRKRKPASE